jgi:hypothetical protein
MGKKKQRSHQVSKGERSNVANWLINAVKKDLSGAQKMVNIVRAWRDGKNPWVTIENPNQNETNKKYIKVKANHYFGDFKKYNSNKKPSTESVDDGLE